MKAKFVYEKLEDVLKPKSETEILNNIVDEIINNYETISISLIHSRGESNLKILNNVGNHFFDRWRSIHGKGIIISVDDSDIEKFEEILYKLEIVYNKIGYSTVLIKDDTKEREIFIELVKTMFKQEFVHFITKKI